MGTEDGVEKRHLCTTQQRPPPQAGKIQAVRETAENGSDDRRGHRHPKHFMSAFSLGDSPMPTWKNRVWEELLERWHLSLALPSHSTRSFLAHAVTAFTSGNDSLVTAPPPPPASES